MKHHTLSLTIALIVSILAMSVSAQESGLTLHSTFSPGTTGIPNQWSPSEPPTGTVGRNYPAVFALDATGLDGSSGGVLLSLGGSGEGCYIGFATNGDFHVRAGSGGAALPNGNCGYLIVPSASAPSGDGTLAVEFTFGANTVRAWWNGVELGSPVARSSGSGSWSGSALGSYAAANYGSTPVGEYNSSVASYTTLSSLRYYWNQTASQPTGTAPTVTSAGSISGTPNIGQALTHSGETYTGTAPVTITRQWLANGSPISGATGTSYTLTAAEDGDDVSVQVTATNGAGSDSATTSAVAATYAAPTKSGNLSSVELTVGVSGSIDFAANLSSGSGGSWSVTTGLVPAGMSHANGVVSGTPTATQGASTLGLTYTNSGGSVEITCSVTVVQGQGVQPENGLTLHSSIAPGTTGIPNQWSSSEPPAGTVGRNYPAVFALDATGLDGSSGGVLLALGGSGEGCYIGFATNGDFHVRAGSGGAALPNANCGYLIVPSASAPSGNGTLVVEFTFGVNTVRAWWNGVELGSPVARSSGSGSWSGSNLGSYAAANYGTMPVGEYNGLVPGYTTLSSLRYYWNQTANDTPVSGTAPTVTSAGSISGTAHIGQTLTHSGETYTGTEPVTVSKQWLANGSPISGATGSSYTLTATEDGDDISVQVTATNGEGSDSATTSTVSATYAAPTKSGNLSAVELTVGSAASIDFTTQLSSGSGGSWSVTSGSVPAGLSHSNGVVSGTPTATQSASTLGLSYTNSGGSVEITCSVTVVAAPQGLDPEEGLTLHSTFAPGTTGIANQSGSSQPPSGTLGRGVPAVFALDATSLDGSSGGILFAFGGGGIGCYAGFASNGDFHVRAGSGGSSIPAADCGYLIVPSASAPSGNGTLVVEFTFGANTVRAWWNGEELGSPVARTSGTSSWTGSDLGSYAAANYGTMPSGEYNSSVASYSTLSSLRYFWNETANDTSSGPTAPTKSGDLSPALLTVGNAASIDFTAKLSSGTGGSWSVTTGSVPAGMSHSNGVVSGTPTATQGASTLGLSYTNSAGSVEITCEVTIVQGGVNDPANAEWVPYPHSSPERYADVALRGITSFPKQYWHCGDRSEVDPDKVMFGMDVSMPWRLQTTFERAGNEYLYWRPVPGVGLENRYSASVRASATDADTWIAAISNHSVGNGGGGLYRTTDYGDTWTKVQAVPNVTGGSSGAYSGQYRTNRRLVDWWRGNNSKWIFVNSTYQCYVSTDNGLNWTDQGDLPGSMGKVFWVACHPTNNNTVYAASASGLWRSQNSGQSWSEISSGLPNKFLVGLDVNQNNANEITVAVLDYGIYRSSNGGTNFNQTLIAANDCAGVVISPADRDVIYMPTARLRRDNTGDGGMMAYSHDGGTSWDRVVPNLSNDSVSEAQADVKGEWLGWTMDDYQLRFRDKGGSKNELRTIIMPHPTIGLEAIGHFSTVFWRTTNGQTWYNQSMGNDTLAWGDASEGNVAWDPQDPDNIFEGVFDDGMYKSTNGGNSWSNDPSGSMGVGWIGGLTQSANYCISVSPQDSNKWVATVGYYATASVAIHDSSGWSFALTGDNWHHNTWCKWHPTNQNVIYTTKWRSTNGGSSWEQYHNIGNAPWGDADDGGVIGVSPADGDVLFGMGTNGSSVYRSADRGTTWTLVANLGYSIRDRRAQSERFAPHESDSRRFYAYDSSSGLQSWGLGLSTISYGGGGMSGVQRIRIDPRYPDVKYLFGRTNGADLTVRRTVDNGQTWENISRNLPRTAAMRSIEIDPYNGDVWAGGTVGRYMMPAPYDDPNTRYWNMRTLYDPTYTGGQTSAFAAAIASVSSSSESGGNVDDNAVDGELSTYWSANGQGEWIRFELSQQLTVESVHIGWHQGDTRQAHFKIEGSTDGTNWFDLLSTTDSSGTTLELEGYDVTDSNCNWVRILGYGYTENVGQGTGNNVSITEMVILGD